MNKIDLQDIELQPLQIPSGWNVVVNHFVNIEPGQHIYVNGLPDGDVWELFVQDMLLIRHNHHGVDLDLGWMPEADPSGKYELTLIRNQDWENPIASYESTSKSKIIEKVNLWLKNVNFNAINEVEISYEEK
jgi:hypothetical protein